MFLREFLGYDPKDESKYSAVLPGSNKKLTEASAKTQNSAEYKGFIVSIEALHCYPYATGNFTRYMTEACKKSLDKWTHPYEKPTILYHNDYDGVINGRIIESSMGKSQNTGGDCLLIKATAPDWKTQDDLSSEILKTVSVGVDASDVRCSICGAHIAEGEVCDHKRGSVYDGKICYWDVYDFTPKELSYVIVPSDEYAQVIDCKYYQDLLGEQDSIPLRNAESQSDLNINLHLQESLNKNIEGKTIMSAVNDDNIQLKESKALVESLQAEKKAWNGDKIAMTEQITQLNNEKVKMQESIQQFKKDIEAKDVELKQEKELKEAAEKKVSDLSSEVKLSLVESLAALREKLNKPKLEKLEDRSIDSLRDSIKDLKAEIEEKALKESKGSVKPENIDDKASKLETKVIAGKTAMTESVNASVEHFDL